MTTRPPLDPQTTDRLVSGLLAPDDAPPGYRHLAQLFSDAKPAAHQPIQPAQLDALVEVILTTADPSGRPATPRKPMLAQLLTAKALAVLGVVTLGVTTAGAATGSLPNSAQGVAHDAFATVGVNVPNTDDATTPIVTHDQGGDNQQGDTPVADQPDDNQGDTPVADVPGDNQGDNNDQGDTPIAGVPGDNQGDNNDQDDTPSTTEPDDNQGDDNDQGNTPSTTEPDDNQGDSQDTGN